MGRHNEIDQIDPHGPRKGHASHRTTHSAWVRGSEYLVNVVSRGVEASCALTLENLLMGNIIHTASHQYGNFGMRAE